MLPQNRNEEAKQIPRITSVDKESSIVLSDIQGIFKFLEQDPGNFEKSMNYFIEAFRNHVELFDDPCLVSDIINIIKTQDLIPPSYEMMTLLYSIKPEYFTNENIEVLKGYSFETPLSNSTLRFFSCFIKQYELHEEEITAMYEKSLEIVDLELSLEGILFIQELYNTSFSLFQPIYLEFTLQQLESESEKVVIEDLKLIKILSNHLEYAVAFILSDFISNYQPPDSLLYLYIQDFANCMKTINKSNPGEEIMAQVSEQLINYIYDITNLISQPTEKPYKVIESIGCLLCQIVLLGNLQILSKLFKKKAIFICLIEIVEVCTDEDLEISVLDTLNRLINHGEYIASRYHTVNPFIAKISKIERLPNAIEAARDNFIGNTEIQELLDRLENTLRICTNRYNIDKEHDIA